MDAEQLQQLLGVLAQYVPPEQQAAASARLQNRLDRRKMPHHYQVVCTAVLRTAFEAAARGGSGAAAQRACACSGCDVMMLCAEHTPRVDANPLQEQDMPRCLLAGQTATDAIVAHLTNQHRKAQQRPGRPKCKAMLQPSAVLQPGCQKVAIAAVWNAIQHKDIGGWQKVGRHASHSFLHTACLHRWTEACQAAALQVEASDELKERVMHMVLGQGVAVGAAHLVKFHQTWLQPLTKPPGRAAGVIPSCLCSMDEHVCLLLRLMQGLQMQGLRIMRWRRF